MIETLKDKYFPVLDHGFVAVKDWMGSDSDIAEMARNSYKLGTKTASDDNGLLRHLMRKRHTSPFERCELVLHCGMPIFVARQWVRHRTASLNEYSGRYSIMPLIFYTPEKNRHQSQSTTNKQGSDSNSCFKNDAHYCDYDVSRDDLRNDMCEHYKDAIHADMARELARIDLPLSMYTYLYWKMDLHNLLHFLSLRLDKHAQWEIREYAKVIAAIVKKWLPQTWKAFEDYRLNGVYLSRAEMLLIRFINEKGNSAWEHDTLWGKAQNDLDMSSQEIREFVDKWHDSVKPIEDYQLDIENARDAAYYDNLAKQSVETQ